MLNLLQPFAMQTDVLQTNSTSNILPSILHLECHVQQQTTDRQLTDYLNASWPAYPIQFPLAARICSVQLQRCLLDPTLAPVMLAPELAPLLNAAKLYIISLSGCQQMPLVNSASPVVQSVGLHRFAFLAAKMNAASPSTSSNNQDTLLGHLNHSLFGWPSRWCGHNEDKCFEYHRSTAEARCWGFDERASITGLCWLRGSSLSVAC